MLKRIITGSFLLIVCTAHPERVLLDGVKVAIYGPQQTDIITYSDLRRPGIDGSLRTLDMLINRDLKIQDAIRYGMKSPPEAVDKQLQTIFRNNKMTEDDFDKMLQAAGYLPDEGREEFALMTDAGQIESFKIYSQLIVPERDVTAYYNQHPEYEPASYEIQRAIVPYDYTKSLVEQTEYIKNNAPELSWIDPFWIDEQDLAEDRQFVKSLPFNEISGPHTSPDGFEYLKVLSKKDQRLKSLEERRNGIIDLLRQPKAEELTEAYHNELHKNATIVHFQ